MQAVYTTLTQINSKVIQIQWTSPDIKIQKSQKPIGKYKKVGKQTRDRLIQMIQEGVSIIKASNSLKINYSTAKSILQNLKKCSNGKESTSSSRQESSLGQICIKTEYQ